MFLLFATLVVYIPAINGGFVWDDDSYVTENQTLRTVEGLKQIWFKPGATTQYYPLVHTSFWIEYHLWGPNPFGFHLVNVLIHGMNALLLLLILRRLAIPGALLAAALFALHPVHVESAAWITERKNLLSGLFYFAALLSYLRYHAGGKRSDYLLSFCLFIMALLSKTVAASLPAAILLIIWWKEGGLQKRAVTRIIPFFAVGIGLGLATVWIETHYLGATGGEWALSITERCLIAGRAVWFYAGKLVWPAALTFIYPRWEIDSSSPAQYLFPVAAIATLGLLWRFRQSIGRGPLVCALFFTGTLAPALGFFNVYPFRFSFVADHFQYLASTGLITLFAAAMTTAFSRIGAGSGVVRATGAHPAARVRSTAALILLTALGVLTWRQCGIYENLETLWRDTIEKNDRCWMAYNNLGKLLAQRGEQEAAIALYERAIAIKPDYDKAHNNLGIALDLKGEVGEAIFHYEKVLAADPGNVIVRNNIAVALTSLGRWDDAIPHLLEGLRLRPGWSQLHTNLAVAFARKGDLPRALGALRQAVALAPDDPEAHFRLASLLHQGGMIEEAILEFDETLRISPDHGRARNELDRLRSAATGR